MAADPETIQPGTDWDPADSSTWIHENENGGSVMVKTESFVPGNKFAPVEMTKFQ